MNATQIGLGVLLLVFLALTGYVLHQAGFAGFYAKVATDSVALLLFVDLSIALGLFMVWMIGDARNRSFSFVPYLLIMLTIGVAGPLLYLIRREAEIATAGRAERARAG